MSTPTLFEWAGGREALEKLTRTFYQKVRSDEILEPVFRDMPGNHSDHVAHFITEVFDGPEIYTVEDGGNHAKMVSRHVGRHLTEVQRKRWMQVLLETADEIGMPSDPEFRSALVGYLEWGSRIAVLNSTSTENPIDPSEPMPKWGWGVPGRPYQG